MQNEHSRPGTAPQTGTKTTGTAHEPQSKDWYVEGYCVVEHTDFPATALADTLNNTGKAPTFAERLKFQDLNYLTSDADGMENEEHDA
jgi:hypothetical protein